MPVEKDEICRDASHNHPDDESARKCYGAEVWFGVMRRFNLPNSETPPPHPPTRFVVYKKPRPTWRGDVRMMVYSENIVTSY